MCVVSVVGDKYSQPDIWPDWPKQIPFPDKYPVSVPETDKFRIQQLENEVRKLKQQFAEMRKELEAAKQQDIDEGNPDCEMDEKTIILKKIADLLGETLDGIFSKEKPIR